MLLFEGHKQANNHTVYRQLGLYLRMLPSGFWLILCNIFSCTGHTSAGDTDDALALRFSHWAAARLKGHITGWLLILITHCYKDSQSLHWLDPLCVQSVFMYIRLLLCETHGRKKISSFEMCVHVCVSQSRYLCGYRHVWLINATVINEVIYCLTLLTIVLNTRIGYCLFFG